MSIHKWLIRARSAIALLTVIACTSISTSAPQPKEKPQPKEVTDQESVDPVEATIILAARNRVISSNNLKQIMLAAHNYHDANGKMPANILDKNGKPILSWRVHLLPYLELQQFYGEFKLDEPWDSEHNLPLVEKMPKVFSSPRITTKKKGYTVYQGFVGPDTVFEAGKVVTFANIVDGASNTIMAVEASTAVPWSKPSDLPFDPKKDVVDFGKALGARPLIGMCDGSVRKLNTKRLSQTTLKNAITLSDGNVLGSDW